MISQASQAMLGVEKVWEVTVLDICNPVFRCGHLAHRKNIGRYPQWECLLKLFLKTCMMNNISWLTITPLILGLCWPEIRPGVRMESGRLRDPGSQLTLMRPSTFTNRKSDDFRCISLAGLDQPLLTRDSLAVPGSFVAFNQ